MGKRVHFKNWSVVANETYQWKYEVTGIQMTFKDMNESKRDTRRPKIEKWVGEHHRKAKKVKKGRKGGREGGRFAGRKIINEQQIWNTKSPHLLQ